MIKIINIFIIIKDVFQRGFNVRFHKLQTKQSASTWIINENDKRSPRLHKETKLIFKANVNLKKLVQYVQRTLRCIPCQKIISTANLRIKQIRIRC